MNSLLTTSSGIMAYKFCNPSQVGHDDILYIADLSLDTLLQNLQNRYLNDIFYTYIGEVCVSVNPNRPDMAIYGTDYMQLYLGKALSQLPPHIYAIANSAYEESFQKGNDCCVIITGESGSGKTEASKLLLLFLAHVLKTNKTAQSISSVETALFNSNYILEAFGNAKTLLNSNSSRFAKYVEVYVGRDSQLSKCDSGDSQDSQKFYAVIHNYMIEKSRVIKQQIGECNFHIFYQLLASIDDNQVQCGDVLRELALNTHSVYKYINSSVSLIDQDKVQFRKVIEAMTLVGFGAHDQRTVLHILAAILHLGNVNFESATVETDDQACRIVPETEICLEHFCRLLALDVALTRHCLCNRKIRTRREVIQKAYRAEQAGNGCDALAKALYERLFYFITSRINASLWSTEKCYLTQNVIGCLDIYGLEVFTSRTNAFEQLLINYCNEKLHQLFVDVVLRKEQALYDREDINWRMVEFEDNAPICALLDEPQRGIFAVLDEASNTTGRQQTNTDEALLSEFNSRFACNAHFQSRKINRSLLHLDLQTDFSIRHYAGDVHYSVEGFSYKNMEQLYVDYKQLMYSSTNLLIKDMWTDGQPSDPSVLAYKMPPTTSFEYRRSMIDLLDRLGNKRQFYVRCIKPNEELNSNQVGSVFNDTKVRHQIKYLGLVELSHVRKAGFLDRYTYKAFIQRYRALYDGVCTMVQPNSLQVADQRSNYLVICKAILSRCGIDLPDNRIAFGKSLIFFRDFVIAECLEKKRLQILEKMVLEIQTHSRLYLAKQRFHRMKMASQIVAQFSRFKKYKQIEELFLKLQQYDAEIRSICEKTPTHDLEFQEMPMFQWSDLPPIEPLLAISCLAGELNKWLIVLKFPVNYWDEKLLRLEASKIFDGKKVYWGDGGTRWQGNYLINDDECSEHLQFKAFFKKNAPIYDSLCFGSYVLKTNLHNLARIRAMLLTERYLHKVDIDSMIVSQWLAIDHLTAVSVTPGADQLVVLHTKLRASDLVFSFYSMNKSSQTSNSSKVGEFVSLLCRQYQRLTKKVLKVNFNKRISFKFANQSKSIEAKASNTSCSERLFAGFHAGISNIITLRRFYELYQQLIPSITSSNDRSIQKLLVEQVHFEMSSRDDFFLIYSS